MRVFRRDSEYLTKQREPAFFACSSPTNLVPQAQAIESVSTHNSNAATRKNFFIMSVHPFNQK
ncbi:MAG: hypothetical protein R2912_03125 [Eubacteriales bacterium]